MNYYIVLLIHYSFFLKLFYKIINLGCRPFKPVQTLP